MPVALDPNARVRYQLHDDRKEDGTEDPKGSFFLLGALSFQQELRRKDLIYTGGVTDNTLPVGTLEGETVRMGLKGWEQFDAPFPELRKLGAEAYSYTELDERDMHALSVLSTKHIGELAQAIQNVQKLSRAEGK